MYRRERRGGGGKKEKVEKFEQIYWPRSNIKFTHSVHSFTVSRNRIEEYADRQDL